MDKLVPLVIQSAPNALQVPQTVQYAKQETISQTIHAFLAAI